MLPYEESVWTTILEEKKCVGSKKVKNVFLNFLVAKADRAIIFKTNHLEGNLNDANRVFENKECSNEFFRNTGCKILKI